MNQNIKYLLELNLATLVLGSSGILGRLIQLPSPLTIFWRCIIAGIVLGAILYWQKIEWRVRSGAGRRLIITSGILLAAHWVTYFWALQVSNVSIAFLSLFTFPIITSFLEPVFFSTKISWLDIVHALIVFTGIFILIPDLDFSNDLTLGVLLGLLSAVLFASRNLVNKKLISEHSGLNLMFYQLWTSAVILSPFLFIYQEVPVKSDILWLLILGIVTTAIGHTLTSTASIITSMQPIYGIILAVIVLGETLNSNTIIGGSLIMIPVFLKNILQYRKS